MRPFFQSRLRYGRLPVMIVAGASAVQIATLVVAGLAVAASVVGIVLNTYFSSRSEHQAWKRDLRVRKYSDCIEAAEKLFTLLGDFDHNRIQTGNDGAVRVNITNDDITVAVELSAVLLDSVIDVMTFGARSVGNKAVEMHAGLSNAAELAVTGMPMDEFKTGLEVGQDALIAFRSAVRKSLRVNDE